MNLILKDKWSTWIGYIVFNFDVFPNQLLPGKWRVVVGNRTKLLSGSQVCEAVVAKYMSMETQVGGLNMFYKNCIVQHLGTRSYTYNPT